MILLIRQYNKLIDLNYEADILNGLISLTIRLKC